jgi:orotidine-5'-phosphate decarboxylase
MKASERVMSERVIVPLDVPTVEAAIELVDRLPQVNFWKVGLELFVSSGSSVLTELKQRQKRIFLDLKLHDIPNTVAGAAAAAARYGVDLLTVHASNGSIGLQQAQASAKLAAQQVGLQPPKIVAVTLLTSIDAAILQNELQVPIEIADYTLKMAQLSQRSGLAGAVCSPQEAARLKQACGESFLLVCPGVRPSWSEQGDQKRVMTPSQALQAGADYLVVGRPITAASDPGVAFERICAELEG